MAGVKLIIVASELCFDEVPLWSTDQTRNCTLVWLRAAFGRQNAHLGLIDVWDFLTLLHIEAICSSNDSAKTV